MNVFIWFFRVILAPMPGGMGDFFWGKFNEISLPPLAISLPNSIGPYLQIFYPKSRNDGQIPLPPSSLRNISFITSASFEPTALTAAITSSCEVSRMAESG